MKIFRSPGVNCEIFDLKSSIQNLQSEIFYFTTGDFSVAGA
jgi:hypothetical protein